MFNHLYLSLLAEGFEQQPANGWKGVFNISSYTQYFNVDTDIVLNRLMSSLYPIGSDFFSKIDANPDLWVLIFFSFSFGTPLLKICYNRRIKRNFETNRQLLSLWKHVWKNVLWYSNIWYKVLNYYDQRLYWKRIFIQIHTEHLLGYYELTEAGTKFCQEK